jgi:uncharacterized membrane protein
MGKMASMAQAGENLSIGQVFSRGLGVIVDNPVIVFGIAFLFGALPSVAITWLRQQWLLGIKDNYQMLGSAAVVLVSMFVGLVLQTLVQGSLVRATLAYARGEKATFSQCVGSALAVVLPLILLGILMVLGIWLGMILLFVPGVMLFVMWSVASPALVAERTGVFEAFGRSRFLTKGARWKVFGIEVILIVVYYVFIGAFAATTFSATGSNFATSISTDGLSFGWIVATVISSTLATTVWSTVQTSLYVELRNWKEGLPEQSLAEIFA